MTYDLQSHLHLIYISFLFLLKLCTKTTITADPSYEENSIELNGKVESFDNDRILRVVRETQKRAREAESCPKELLDFKIKVVSENNFPTAAGLASSASGYACLVYALAQLYGLAGKEEISDIARLGSGEKFYFIFSLF